MARDYAVILTAPALQAETLSPAIRDVPAIGVDRDVLSVYGEGTQVPPVRRLSPRAH